MSATENNPKTQKPKTSKLAIAALIFGVLSLCTLGMVEPRHSWCGTLPARYLEAVLLLRLFAVIGLFLGIVALVRIAKMGARSLRGHGFAIAAIVAGVVSLLLGLLGLAPRPRPPHPALVCRANLKELGIAMRLYADDRTGKYPSPDKWCDLLEKGNYVLGGWLRCPRDKKGPCSYAINPNAEPNSPLDIVLLFETKGGWNQFGGPELLTTENHEGKGCNILLNDRHVKFVRTEQLNELKWKVEEEEESDTGNFRRPGSDEELKYWLKNMVWYHRLTNEEISTATGLTEKEIVSALKKFNIQPGNRPKRGAEESLLVMPYPGGRHPRIGFLDGAIDPQRETKFSVFTPWDANSYVVVDVPEAIWSNLGLTYLAHTHIDTIWTKQGIDLPKLEWNRRADGTLDIERKLPNGIAFGMQIKPTKEAVRMELWLKNGTNQKLSDLRVQNCVMTKMAAGFEQQTNDNKVLTNPYVACRSSDSKRWIITAWENCNQPWGNDKCPCFHSDPKFPDLEPGQTYRLHGWLSFYEGTNIKAEFERIESTGWRDK
jgi:hypothetical protein